MQISFRKAEMADLEEIYRLVKDAVAHMEEQNIMQWDELYPTRDDLLTDIEKDQLTVGVIEGIIAVIYVLNQESADEYASGNWQRPAEPYFVIHRLCVSPAFQNRGVGRQTLLQIEKNLKDSGIYAIRLDVFTQNPFALRLYEGLGYVKTGYADWRKGHFLLMEKYI